MAQKVIQFARAQADWLQAGLAASSNAPDKKKDPSNIEERVNGLCASSARTHRDQKPDENAEKLRWLPDYEK